MTENTVRAIIATVAFLIGLFVGYVIWHRDKGSKTLSALQIVSVGVFFAYLGFTSFGNVEYSDIVAISILAMTAGEPIGKAFGKLVETKETPKK